MGPFALAAALVAYNALANRWRPFHGWAYVPANLTLAAAVLAAGAWGFGLDRDALGLRAGPAWPGIAIAAAAMVPVYGLLGFERGRAALRDRRLEGVRGGRAAYMLAVRIPVGTALVEEIAFRGVLLAALATAGTASAIGWSAVAFGLWHVVPTAILARTNGLSRLTVPAGVALTAAAGALLAWLRVETGSLAAPFLLHALVNTLGAGAALIALRSGPAPEGS